MQKPKSFRPWQPEQTTLLPPSPSDWLPDDHQVHFLLDLVDELDLSQVLIPAQAKDPRGEMGFDPRMPGGPGELPPEAPTDPYVTLSRHPAPVIQPLHAPRSSNGQKDLSFVGPSGLTPANFVRGSALGVCASDEATLQAVRQNIGTALSTIPLDRNVRNTVTNLVRLDSVYGQSFPTTVTLADANATP